MTADDIAALRADLTAQLDALVRDDELGLEAQKPVQLDQQSVGRLSRMDALQQQAMAKATNARRATMRLRLQATIARIDASEFGYCLNCGDEIAPQRLRLDPTAPTCISCARGG